LLDGRPSYHHHHHHRLNHLLIIEQLFATTEIFDMRITLLLFALPACAMADVATASSSVEQIESFWIDASDVLDNLDDYQALWIKPHGCV
jgi:hypothetical protein